MYGDNAEKHSNLQWTDMLFALGVMGVWIGCYGHIYYLLKISQEHYSLRLTSQGCHHTRASMDM